MGPTKKIYLSSFIFGLFVILLIIFSIYPLFKEVKKNSENLLLQKKKLILFEIEKENIKELEKNFKNYQADLTRIENLFITPEVPIEFINFLETISKDSKIELEISSIVKETGKEASWPSLSFQLSAIGSFPNFLKFLKKLENSPYLIEIFNFNIQKLTKKELGAFSPGDIESPLLIKVFTK